ncbi:MAG: ribose-phosphate pyrophosphokinase [Clostridia bacterium]|nr:ribose-phosphate pyrophosphokinase [Clostridia bacterium]
MPGQKITAEDVFKEQDRVAPLKIISLEGASELAKKVDYYLVSWAKMAGWDQYDTFLLPAECPRFTSGEAKGIIYESVRGDDLFVMVDVGNYNVRYKMFGQENRMSSDDHYQDLKRIIQAASGRQNRLNVIMPMLYGGRQHRRSYRESLDCAYSLQEMHSMGVENLVTFDAHDPRVQNAVPLMGFDNFMPYYQVIKALFRAYPDLAPCKDNFMVVSPDEGAINRNMYYASVLGVNMGMFYKRRDYSRVVEGRNPIVAHEYLGESMEGKDVFIADDIIASGDSVLDIAYEMKRRKANRVFAYATYAIFTAGYDKIDKAVADGVLDGIFGTNLTYISQETRSKAWFHEVDVSKYLAYIIAALNHNLSVAALLDPHEKINALLKKRGLR